MLDVRGVSWRIMAVDPYDISWSLERITSMRGNRRTHPPYDTVLIAKGFEAYFGKVLKKVWRKS